MKANDISVSVSDFDGELFVNITFKLRGQYLEREAASPDPLNADAEVFGRRVREGARKAKAKQLRKLLEAIEFPEE